MEQIYEKLCAECKNHMPNDKNQNKETILHFTVRSKHDKCMEVLLEAGTDVNQRNYSTLTPLMIAAYQDYVDGVQKLIQAGADVNRRGDNDKTALILAGSEGHDRCVELLLNAGADANVLTSSGKKHFTALHAAVDRSTIRMGANVNRSEENKMELTAQLEGADRCIELLLNAGADVNALTGGISKHVEHVTALHSAVCSRNITHVNLLLKAGADVNKEGYESIHKGVTALCLAAGHWFVRVKILVEAGANVNQVPKNGGTPLMETIQFYDDDANNRAKCIELLLDAGADVNAECEGIDDTALHLALRYIFPEAVELLICAGADVNKVHLHGITPLMQAPLVWDQPVNNIVKCF